MESGFRRSCKPISVCPLPGRESFILATEPGTRRTCVRSGAGRSWVPYLVLHRMGFTMPSCLRATRWALTPPFHPYPGCPGRFVFCGTGRRRVSRLRLPRVSRLKNRVTRHPALRCSDFPPLRRTKERFSASPKSGRKLVGFPPSGKRCFNTCRESQIHRCHFAERPTPF